MLALRAFVALSDNRISVERIVIRADITCSGNK